jgi:hypothetical protein
MDDNSQRARFQFQVIDLLALTTVVSVLAASIRLSARYLPPISEMPPFDLGGARHEQNWIGQGGLAFAGYAFLLLAAAYCVKWIILTNCTRRLTAVHLFSLFGILSLPYIWFLCEPDWFNAFIYRISCWIGGPIAIWFVPTVSFLVDLRSCRAPKSVNRYLIRSGVEVLVAFPLWAIFWAFFSFWILGWGWI